MENLKSGTDAGNLANSTGGVTNASGQVIISSDSAGGAAYMFGPGFSRAVYGYVANGAFSDAPQDPASVLSNADNPLPYFDLESSGTGITAEVVADATVASGNALKFTIASGTAVGTYLYIKRKIAVLGSAARSYTYQARSAWKDASASTTEVQVRNVAQFYQNDGATTTGTAETRTATLTTVAASTWAYEVLANANGTGAVPADAAFLEFKTGVYVATATTAAYTVELAEVRLDSGPIQSIITDQVNPEQFGYGVLYLADGVLWMRPNETGKSGSSPIINMVAQSGNIGLDASKTGVAIPIFAASRTGSVVTIHCSTVHGLNNTNWAIVAGLTGAAGTTMNGIWKVTILNTFQFTYTATGTAGSATVTGATVKAGAAAGNISFYPSHYGKVFVETGGLDITGTIEANKNYGTKGLHRGVSLYRNTALSIASATPVTPTLGTTTAITWSGTLKNDDEAVVATVSDARGDGTTVTYTLNGAAPGINCFVNITGITPAAYNLSTARVVSSDGHKFTVTNAATGTYVSGGSVAIVAMWGSGANITIPVTGAYAISFSSQFGSGSGYNAECYLFVDSTLRLSSTNAGLTTSTYDHFQLQGILYLDAGNVLSFRAAATAAGKSIQVAERLALASVVLIGAW